MSKQTLLFVAVSVVAALLAAFAITHIGQTAHSPPKGTKVLTLTKSNFDEIVLKSDKPVLVDFWAAWCGPCNALSPVIEQLAKDYEGEFVIGKVNVQEEEELADKYGISAIPALLFFKDGELKKSVLGIRKKQELVDILKGLAEAK
jgi:thioredoxin 1